MYRNFSVSVRGNTFALEVGIDDAGVPYVSDATHILNLRRTMTDDRNETHYTVDLYHHPEKEARHLVARPDDKGEPTLFVEATLISRREYDELNMEKLAKIPGHPLATAGEARKHEPIGRY